MCFVPCFIAKFVKKAAGTRLLRDLPKTASIVSSDRFMLASVKKLGLDVLCPLVISPFCLWMQAVSPPAVTCSGYVEAHEPGIACISIIAYMPRA